MNSHMKKEETITSLLDKLHEGLKFIEELKSQLPVKTINNNITTFYTNNITLNCFYSPKIDHVDKSFFTSQYMCFFLNLSIFKYEKSVIFNHNHHHVISFVLLHYAHCPQSDHH